jgi:uncharacterized protein
MNQRNPSIPSAGFQANLDTNQRQPSVPPTGLRGLATRYPLTLFLVWALGVAYASSGLVLLARQGVIPGGSLPTRLGLDYERAAVLPMMFLGLLPATLLVTGLEGGRPALGALFRRVVRWRVGLVWWLLAVVALPLTTIVLATVLGDSLRMPSLSVLAGEVVSIAIAILLVNIWEETAWAGFFQTRLERRHNFYIAALLTAIPFAAIHMPLQVINGMTKPMDLAVQFMLLVIFSFIFRSLLGTVLRGAGDSVLVVGVLHTFFNRSNNTDGIVADLLLGSNRQMAALLATTLLTIVMGVIMRRRLSRAYRQELDAMNAPGVAARPDAAAIEI